MKSLFELTITYCKFKQSLTESYKYTCGDSTVVGQAICKNKTNILEIRKRTHQTLCAVTDIRFTVIFTFKLRYNFVRQYTATVAK